MFAGSTHLLPALFKTLILPPLIVRILFVGFFRSSACPVYIEAAVYLASWPVLYILRSHLSLFRSIRSAHQLGASPVPRVKGRWVLNLDIMMDWAKSGEEEEVGRMMELLERRYGRTCNTRVLGEDQIITSDSRIIRHCLVDEWSNFVKGDKFRVRAQGFLGDGIFNADGDRWKFHRDLTRPFFRPVHMNPSRFTPHIAAFLSGLPPDNQGDGVAVDVQERLGRLALDMALDWICGEGSPCLDSSADGSDPVRSRPEGWSQAREEIGPAMRTAQKIVGKRVKIGTLWPLFEIGQNPLAGPMKVIHAFFDPLITEAEQRALAPGSDPQKSKKSSNDREFRLIDQLVKACDGDRILVRDQLINILLAARDTTASLLTFCMYALALHPDAQKEVKMECLRVSGEGHVTKEQIGRCIYSFGTESDAKVSVPFYMPANTSIILNTLHMQRDKATWGEDALEFKPERWETRGGWEGFAAWNLGPRMCLGQPFALTAVHTFLILLMRHLGSVQDSRSPHRPATIKLAPEAGPSDTRMPKSWQSRAGDGRARGGRDRVWIVADVVLAVKGGLWVAIG